MSHALKFDFESDFISHTQTLVRASHTLKSEINSNNLSHLLTFEMVKTSQAIKFEIMCEDMIIS